MNEVLINGNAYPFTGGQTILQLFKGIGIEIPALCYDDRLHPASVCRLCLVQIKGNKHLQPACRTLLTDRMEIETHLPVIESYRSSVLQMLAKDYPMAAVSQQPQKEFHRWLQHYHIEGGTGKAVAAIDTSHPYLQVDMSRCINCYRCLHICDDLQGQFVWHIVNRGSEIHIVSDSKDGFKNSSCVSCGACADTCPSGAIEDKNETRFPRASQTTRSVCAYCGVGCEIEIGTANEKIVGIRPAMNAPVNKGHLCVKGRYAWEYEYAGDRVFQPMIRIKDEWKVVSWYEAIQYCAQRLGTVLNANGPDSIGIIGSARATNEDNYLIQKFARAVIGTNNVDNCARVCHQPTAKAMSMLLGTGASTNSFDDIEHAACILVAGSNTTGSHPVVGARIKQMALKGTGLIVIDPRKTELATYATLHLQIRAGTNIPLLNAMANVIIEENLHDPYFIKNRTEGWENYRAFITDWSPERAAIICQVHPRKIREAARLYATRSPAMSFHGLGLTEHTQGTESVMALVNLALITGNIGRQGAGINPLRGQNNVQGAAAMGCDPAVYTGMASVKTERSKFEALWKTALPAGKGLNLVEMMESAAAGKLKAMWITGYDVFFTLPDAGNTETAFDKLEFIIVQDLFPNETAKKFADVFLPVASSFEREGTFMNAERRIQKIRKAVPPPLQTKADWEIVCLLAAAMGHQALFNFSTPEAIWNEIRSAWSAVQGITYTRLDERGIQWPCPSVEHPGTAILHLDNFPTKSKKARLAIVEYKPTPEQASPDYPFLLITGRELFHFNAGTMTYRTANKELCGTDLLHLHPEDANDIGLITGDRAKIFSRYGNTILPVCIDDSLRKGEAFSTFSSEEVFINKITSPRIDSFTKTPEYKVTAVRIEKIS